MSQATRQAMTILAVINGGLFLMAESGELPPEVAHTVLWAKDFCKEVLRTYPETGDKHKNTLVMKAWLRRWDEIGSVSLVDFHPMVVATLSLNFAEDLLDKVRNRARADIETLRDALIRVSYHFTDEDHAQDQHFEEASAMAEELYSVIGFSR